MGAVALLIVGAIAMAMVVGLVGLVIGLVFTAVALVLKVLPVLLIGFLVVKVIQRVQRPRGVLTTRSEAWLDRRD